MIMQLCRMNINDCVSGFATNKSLYGVTIEAIRIQIILVAFLHNKNLLQRYNIFVTFPWQWRKNKKDMLS